MLIRTVTCFIVQSGRVLLQERPAGKPWAGVVNGPGGKVNPGEAAVNAVVREVHEETDLRVIRPEQRGSLTLHVPTPRPMDLSVEIFIASKFRGEACEREGTLTWYDVDALPFECMWPDQRYWLGAVFDGLSVSGVVAYSVVGLGLKRCQLRLDFRARR